MAAGDPFIDRTLDDARVRDVLAAPECDRPAVLHALARDVPHGVRALARIAVGADGALGEEARRLFGDEAERFDRDDIDRILRTEDGVALRAVLLALGSARCADVMEILEARVPDVVAQYMMHVDWGDDAELLDLVRVLASVSTAMALWSLAEIVHYFPGSVGEAAEEALAGIDD